MLAVLPTCLRGSGGLLLLFVRRHDAVLESHAHARQVLPHLLGVLLRHISPGSMAVILEGAQRHPHSTVGFEPAPKPDLQYPSLSLMATA